MFLINSRYPRVCAAFPIRRAPLLPKLRGHFAEFLQHGSLKRLSIPYLFTCVSLGYGWFCTLNSESPSQFHEVFSWELKPCVKPGWLCSPLPNHPIYEFNKHAWFSSQSNFVAFVYPSDVALSGFLRDRFTLRRLTERRNPGTGRRSCFSHDLSLLMSAFSLLISPGVVTNNLPRLTERSATDT